MYILDYTEDPHELRSLRCKNKSNQVKYSDVPVPLNLLLQRYLLLHDISTVVNLWSMYYQSKSCCRYNGTQANKPDRHKNFPSLVLLGLRQTCLLTIGLFASLAVCVASLQVFAQLSARRQSVVYPLLVEDKLAALAPGHEPNLLCRAHILHCLLLVGQTQRREALHNSCRHKLQLHQRHGLAPTRSRAVAEDKHRLVHCLAFKDCPFVAAFSAGMVGATTNVVIPRRR